MGVLGHGLQLWLTALLVVLVHGQELNFSVPGRCVGRNFVPSEPLISPFLQNHEGFRNNPLNPFFGARGRVLRRQGRSAYADGVSLPSGGCTLAQRKAEKCPNPGEHILANGTTLGSVRPLARQISNIVARQRGVIGSERGIADIAVHWGQALAHDTELTPFRQPLEAMHMQIPPNDPVFKKGERMDFFRSLFEFRCTGEEFGKPREQLNLISAFIDGTFVYGGTLERAQALRGRRGKMLLTKSGLPPRLGEREFEADNPTAQLRSDLYFCGDVRCNEAIGLLSMITLLLREHNYRADQYLRKFPRAPSNAVYEWARKMVIATIQSITFNEYLPALFGRRLQRYKGYNPRVRPELDNIFSTAARRFGHSQINPTVERVNAAGRVYRRFALQRTLFRVSKFVNSKIPIDPYFRGFLSKRAQQMDPHVDSAVRNRLFEAQPGGARRDLAATNIQRGRDHGLPDMGTIRQRLGLKPKYKTTDDISSNKTIQELLQQAYGGKINLVDLFVGGLAEDRLLGSEFGQTFTRILLRNFFQLRKGDRFWFERILGPKDLADVKASTLSAVIRRNTRLRNLHRGNLFFDRKFCGSVVSNQCIPRKTKNYYRVCRLLRMLAARNHPLFLRKLVMLRILSNPKKAGK